MEGKFRRTVNEEVRDTGKDDEQGILDSGGDQVDVSRQVGHVEDV